MSREVSLFFNISGCPTACMHCWANGGIKGFMPFDAVKWALDSFTEYFCRDNYELIIIPFLEMLAHPDIAKILQIVKDFSYYKGQFQMNPMVTTGVPVGLRDDWEEVLDAVKRIGITDFWLTFHGMGEIHDRIAGLEGAFEKSCLAVRRIRSAGFNCGCNMLVNKQNIRHINDIIKLFEDIGINNKVCWETVHYYPLPRLRKYQELRPELKDISAISELIAEKTLFNREAWNNSGSLTEGALYKKAVEQSHEFKTSYKNQAETIQIICTKDLDIYTGVGNLLQDYCGNLKSDGVKAVLDRAVNKLIPKSEASLYFICDKFPKPAELAQRVGNTNGQQIYLSGDVEMYYRWLDLYLNNCRKFN